MATRLSITGLILAAFGLGSFACLDAGLLDGKLCDEQGACLGGYVCDAATGRCVPVGDGPGGGSGVTNLGPEALEWLCASEQVIRLTEDSSLDTDSGRFEIGQDLIEPDWFQIVPQRAEGAPELAVMALAAFHVQPNASLRVEGERALVILTCQEVDIKGSLDASGRAGQMSPGGTGSAGQGGPGGFPGGAQNGRSGQGPGGGAGGQEADCQALVDSGGAGGGFIAPGGAGGDGFGDEGCVRPGPEGGPAAGRAELVPLLGGSGGGGGGDGSGGPGGGGGGAIELVSAGTISIAQGAVIRAAGGGGAGGHDGQDSSAGGGGGAGGAILLEAPSVTVGGALVANGGGGGAGYPDNDGWGDLIAPAGSDGGLDASPATGGAGADLGGGGGEGGAGRATAGHSGQRAQNGGGGGGAAGRIRINTAAARAMFEPDAVISPSDDPGGCSGGCSQATMP